MKKVRVWILRLILAFLLILAAPVIAFLCKAWWYTRQLNSVPLSPANYEPAAIDLVKLSQSDPSFYSRESVGYLLPFNPVWAPASVTKLDPEDLEITANQARVFWGGGFYHCGWDIQHESLNRWTVYFMQDNQRTKTLETIDVPTDLKVTEGEYVNGVLSEIDRRLSLEPYETMSNVSTWALPAGRCIFLTKHHRLDLLPAEVHKSAANYPHDWRDVLLRYLLDQRSKNASASDTLMQWANRTTGPAAWIYAAYAFYQADNKALGDQAIKKAISINTSDPEWLGDLIPSYEYAMATRLYQSGQMYYCAALCDGILSSKHVDFSNASAVRSLRNWAHGASTSRPAQLPTYDEFTSLDPFGGFDLRLLTSAMGTSQP